MVRFVLAVVFCRFLLFPFVLLLPLGVLLLLSVCCCLPGQSCCCFCCCCCWASCCCFCCCCRWASCCLLQLLLLLGVLLSAALLLPLGVLLLLLLLLLLGILLLLLLLLPVGRPAAVSAAVARLGVAAAVASPVAASAAEAVPRVAAAAGLLRSLLPSLLLTGYGGLRNGIRLRRALEISANLRLNAPDPAHIHDANRSARRWRTLADLLDLGWWKRAAGILIQRRLLPVERNRSRRRSPSRHHGPAQHIGRRTRSPGSGVCPGAQNTLSSWRDGRSGEDLDPGKFSRRHRRAHPASPGVPGRRCLAEPR